MANAGTQVKVKDPAGTLQLASEFEQMANAGFEGTSSADYALPFLKLLQKMSPEVDPDGGSYIDGAKAGMFLDTATLEVFDSVDFIPCHYRRAIVEWAGEEPGSGFVAQHEPGYENQPQMKRHMKDGHETGKWVTPEGHILQDTRYFFGLRLAADGSTYIDVLSLTSTQIKKSRTWLTRMQGLKATGAEGRKFTLPMFANVWRLTSVPESKDDYNWRGYKIDLVGPIQDAELAQTAKKAREMFLEAAAKVKPPEDGAAAKGDEEVPF